MAKNENASGEYLTEAELAKRWRVSRRTLQRWRAKGELPFYHKFGGRIRYAMTDVERIEAAARIEVRRVRP